MKLFKKFLSVIFGGVMASTFSLSAEEFTVDDLCDPSMIAVDRLHWCILDNPDYNDKGYDQESPIGLSNQVTIERVYDNNAGRYYNDRVNIRGIRICNDKLGLSTTSLGFQFLLAKDDNTVTTDGYGSKLIIDVSHYMSGNGTGYYDNSDLDNKGYAISTGYVWDMGSAIYGRTDLVYNFNYKNMKGFWEGEISRDAYGDIHIDFSKPAIITNTQANPSYQNSIFAGSYVANYHYLIIDKYHIDLMKSNAVLSGSWAQRNRVSQTSGSFAAPVAHDDYRCRVNFLGNGEFEVINLTENGYAVRIGDPEGYHNSHLSTVKGGYNLEMGVAWLNGGQGVYITPAISNNDKMMHNPYPMRMANIYRNNAQKTYDFEDVVGEASETGDLSHRLKHTHWVTDGGTLRTFESGINITFPDFGYVFAQDTIYWGDTPVRRFEYSPCYTDNNLSIAEDVTLELGHHLDVFGVSTDGKTLMVQTTVTPIRNTKYVESYELWMIPKQTNVNVNAAPFDHESGHTKGYQLASYKPAASASAPALRAGETHDSFQFFKILDLSTLPTANKHYKNEYSFYVKANYKPETGLHPTFHNLVNHSEADDIVTGIEEVEGGVQGVSVSTESGAIIVKEVGGSASSVEVYTPAGVTVYRGAESRIEVGAGLYIVRVGSFTTKVVVP